MAVTDEQVRHAIKGLIKAAYPTVRAYEWNCLSHRLDEWPGMFRTSDSKTHGWIIKRSAWPSEWKGSGGRVRTFWIYDVWAFYGFRTGKEGDNSDDEFSEILKAVYEALQAAPTLELGEVEGHELLQFDMITTIDCGEETLHWAKGNLKVRLCC